MSGKYISLSGGVFCLISLAACDERQSLLGTAYGKACIRTIRATSDHSHFGNVNCSLQASRGVSQTGALLLVWWAWLLSYCLQPEPNPTSSF
jgi:hypothetical protein